MNARTTSIVALMFLALGGGTGFVKLVSPAMAERDKLQNQNRDLTGQSNKLNADINELEKSLNAMAMGQISYFDLSREANKPRTMEAKTVETLASLTEILNDNHIRIQALDPKGETEGLNKPVPKPPSPSPAPGASPGAAAAAPTPTPTPTLAPGATPPPPPIQLTHKMFRFEVEGEYPDLVKALREFQGLPRAISINDYQVKLVNDEKSVASHPQGAAGKGSPTSDSLSLIGLTFDLSVTFLMDTGGLQLAQPTSVPASPVPHAATWLADLGGWLCPPAEAAAAQPRPAVRPPNAVKAVRYANGVLTLQTATGSTPTFRVLGSRPGFMAIELQRTVTTVPVLFHPSGPGVKQIVAMPSPTDPLATHLAISVDPGTRLRVALSPTKQLQIFVEGLHASKPAAPGANVLAGHPAAVTPAAGARPAAPKPAAAPASASKPANAPAPAAAKPVIVPVPVAGKAVTAAPLAAQRPIVAVLPPHRVPTPAELPGAKPAAPQPAKLPVAPPSQVAAGKLAVAPPSQVAQGKPTATAAAPARVGTTPASSLKIVVRPNAAPIAAALEPERDHVAPETVRAWERQQLRATSAEGSSLHLDHERVPVAVPVQARPQDPTLVGAFPVAQTVVALPQMHAPVRPQAHPPAQPQPLVQPPAGKPVGPSARVLIAAAPAPGLAKARPNAFERPAAAPKPGPAAKAPQAPTAPTHLDGARVEGDELVIGTHGGAASFTVLGGNQHLLLLEVANMPLPGQGRLLPVGVAGIKQVRAALYDNRGPISHLAIDTDGTIRLAPVADDAGNIRLRITGPHVKAQADVTTSAVTATTELHAPKPAAAKPTARPTAKPVAKPKPVVIHPKPQTRMTKPTKPVQAGKPTGLAAPSPLKDGAPTSPSATPTPMAVPHHPAAATRPQAGRSHVSFDGRHLEHNPATTYRFPLERDKPTGRANPFKPIPNPLASPLMPPGGEAPSAGGNAKPAPLPAVPPAPGGAPGSAGGASSAGYMLKAVMIGGGAPPQALISVGGHSLMVGLNQALPGNVKVKSIQTDYVILSADGRTIRLNLKR
jgi:hypothetical protein